jgi:hypothetical protein
VISDPLAEDQVVAIAGLDSQGFFGGDDRTQLKSCSDASIQARLSRTQLDLKFSGIA